MSERFGELRSALARELESEDELLDLIDLVEAWPDVARRDEIAWPYTFDRLRAVEHPRAAAPARPITRALAGSLDADLFSTCGSACVQILSASEAPALRALAHQVDELAVWGRLDFGHDDVLALLGALDTHVDVLSLNRFTLTDALVPAVREMLDRVRPRALKLWWCGLDDYMAVDLFRGEFTQELEELSLGMNWSSYEPLSVFEELSFARLRVFGLDTLDIGSDGLHALLANPSFRQLEQLDLELNDLTDYLLADLARSALAPSIQVLDVGYNNGFGSDGVAALADGNFLRLRELAMASSRVDDEGLEALSRAAWLPSLRSLDLSYSNSISSKGLTALLSAPGLGALERLELDFSPLGKRGVFEALSNLTSHSLTKLMLSDTGCGSEVARLLASDPRFEDLCVVNLSKSSLDDEDVFALCASLPHLSELMLGECDFGPRAIDALHGSAWHLRRLSLPGNSLGDDGVRALARWPGLASVRSLNVSESGASFEALEHLLRSPHLRSLNHLSIYGHKGMGEGIVDLLSTLPIARSLCALVLDEGALGERGFTKLATSPTFANMVYLSCSRESTTAREREIVWASETLSASMRHKFRPDDS